QAFLRALDRESSDAEACRGLMRAARLLGRPGAAVFFGRIEQELREDQRDERAARRVLSAHPRDARARLALARALLRRGKPLEARNHLQIAAEQPDGGGAPPALRRVERMLSVL